MNGIWELRDVTSDYDHFCRIAKQLEWIDIKERHEALSCERPLAVDLDAYEFPAGYVRKNMVHAYVRGIMSSIAFYEEWDKDFWKIPEDERKICLECGQELYKNYAIPKELRLVERDWKYLVGEMEIFAGGGKKDQTPLSEWKRYLSRFEDAAVIEIGGCYASDYEYLAIKNDNMLFVSCGYWD